MKKELSIYVHWPWCKKKCPYCDFNSHVAADAPYKDYIKSIITDLEHQKTLTGDRNVVSIFFGGGTPSLMKPEYIKRIINKIYDLYTVNASVEITMEVNPTSSNITKFKEFKEAGINRLSIGVQSFNSNDLIFLGREHNEKDAYKTVEDALSIFNNVSFDLIFGLPNQKLEDWHTQLEYAAKIGTQHLSAYQLTIEQNTAFFSQVKKNAWQPMDDDKQADFYECTKNTLCSHNYNHYEISNFALDKYDCKHNHKIWQYGDYIGVGAGAHGRLQTTDNKRISTQNYKIPNKYIDSVKHVEHGIYQSNIISSTQEWQETILMGLRIQKGVPRKLLHDNNASCQALPSLFKLGLLHENGDNIILTDKGELLLDSVLQEIIL